MTLLGGEELERVNAEFVSANLFPMLGVSPVRGRAFIAEDEQRKEHVAVLSYAFWQRRLAVRTLSLARR